MNAILAIIWGILAIALFVATPESIVAIFFCVAVFTHFTYRHIKKQWEEENGIEHKD